MNRGRHSMVIDSTCTINALLPLECEIYIMHCVHSECVYINYSGNIIIVYIVNVYTLTIPET